MKRRIPQAAEAPDATGPVAAAAAAETDTIPGQAAFGPDRGTRRRGRGWARIALAAQVVFVASWLLAEAWQGPHYSFVAHSISDMYAETAPGAAFLIVVFTLCGAATMVFAWRSLWSALRPASRSGGVYAAIGSALVALSIFGLGDLLTATERLGCRLADPGCTAAKQLSNTGGTMDYLLSTAGVACLIVGGFLLVAAMRRTPGWETFAPLTRWWMSALIVIFVCDGAITSLSGLFERILALGGAAWIALAAREVLRRTRS